MKTTISLESVCREGRRKCFSFCLSRPAFKNNLNRSKSPTTQWKNIQLKSQPLAQINSAKAGCSFCTCGCKFTFLNWRGFARTSQHPTQWWQAGHSGHDWNPGFSKTKTNFSKHRVCLISFKLGWIIQICLNLKYSSCELSPSAAADSYPPPQLSQDIPEYFISKNLFLFALLCSFPHPAAQHDKFFSLKYSATFSGSCQSFTPFLIEYFKAE